MRKEERKGDKLSKSMECGKEGERGNIQMRQTSM
jgi:hypothetical protein